MLYGAIDAKVAVDMHHIASIKDAPHLRMEPSNWLALCRPCHETLEGEVIEGMRVKRWSEANYTHAMHGSGQDRGCQKSTGSVVNDRSLRRVNIESAHTF
jgi:hypothetical protein